MKAFRTFVLSTVVAVSLIALCPAPTRAADYWNGYWSWYDGTYRPYYQRYYSSGPVYSGPSYSYYPPASGYGYYGPGYSTYGYGYASPYGSPYGGTYYGAPGAGVGVYPGTAAVRVGPLGIGWR